MTDDERRARGLAALDAVSGPEGRAVVERVAAVSPALADHLVRFAFGDVISGPALGLREREIATVAALAAMGNAAPQLKVHLRAAMRVGCTREEIIEVILQVVVYAGFPAGLNALFAAEEVFNAPEVT